MKKILTLAVALLCTCATNILLAQGPAKFNYQGIARNSSGQALASQALGLRLTIHDGSSTGTTVYQETQSVTTNAYGLYNVQIGGGTVISGTIAGVSWSSGSKYIQVELDPAGGTNYTDLGATQLLSVPYALYANATAGGSGVTGSGTANYVSKFTGASAVGNSEIFDNGTSVGIGTTTPLSANKLEVDATAGNAGSFTTTSTTSNGIMATGGAAGVYGVGNGAGATYSALLNPCTPGVAGTVRTTTTGRADGMLALASDPSSVGESGLLAVADSNTLGNYGVECYAFDEGGTGGNYALYAYSDGSGASGEDYAGYFTGSLYATSASSSIKAFKIDDPMDPANKYLYHSSVESNDMMDLYNGNATTDANGDATITLPSYFTTLNKEYKYQLTCIGQFAQAIIAEEVNNNQFKIKTDKPNVKVSWQVAGVRQDAAANAYRVKNEVEKPANEKGTYLMPELYGKGREFAPGYKTSSLAKRAAAQTKPAGNANDSSK